MSCDGASKSKRQYLRMFALFFDLRSTLVGPVCAGAYIQNKACDRKGTGLAAVEVKQGCLFVPRAGG